MPDSWLTQINLLADFISNTTCLLENFSYRLSDKVPEYRYPFSAYLKSWKMLADRFKVEIKRFSENGYEVLVSTIVNWVMPSLCMGYNELFVFIEKYSR